MQDKDKEVYNYLAVTDKDYAERSKVITETFKGQVDDTNVQFPKGLGAAHPFDFSRVDIITNNIGIADAAVDKITDAIIGDFTIKVQTENAQALLDDFADESNLKTKLRPWIKEAVSKGNGFMELDLKDVKNIEKIRVMNANNMYVRRTKKGKVLGYNQFKGKLQFFTSGSKPIPFTPKEIAHLTINKTPNDPYGRGLVWANRVTLENYASAELDLHKLISRKAGAPMHVKLGQPGEKVRPSALDEYKASLQYMTNSTEWVTDANTEIKLIDFTGIGDNLTKAAEHDLEQFALGMKIPMSILGISNNPEGLAKVNDKGFLRFIESIRGQVEQVVENQILRPYLRSQSPSLDEKVEFIWELPGEDEKNERLAKITDTLKIMDLSPELRAALEIEYSEIMGLEVVKLLPTPQDARKKADSEEAELKKQEDLDRKAEEQIKQPEVPGAKKTANQSANILKEVEIKTPETEKIEETHCKDCNITEAQAGNMTLAQYVNLKDIAGFNYSDYLVNILRNLKVEKFDDLLAITERDLAEGLLPKRDVNKLRIILKDGFRKNKTIKQIEKDINQSINLRDRVMIQEDGTKKITLSASKRPIAIARTETVRVANAGLKSMYIENDVSSYRYLAALDDRTSEICMSLDGQVFLTKDGTPGVNMPPMHPMCRSSIVGLVD